MVRTFLIVITTVLMLVCTSWSADNVSPEVADFLKHRNVLLSLAFEIGSNELTTESQAALDRVISDLRSLLSEQKIVRIEGHASPVGKEDFNLVLSMRRAMAVQEYLHSRYGFELDLFFNGYGSGKSPAEKRVQLAFYDDTLGLALADIDSVVTQ